MCTVLREDRRVHLYRHRATSPECRHDSRVEDQRHALSSQSRSRVRSSAFLSVRGPQTTPRNGESAAVVAAFAPLRRGDS